MFFKVFKISDKKNENGDESVSVDEGQMKMVEESKEGDEFAKSLAVDETRKKDIIQELKSKWFEKELFITTYNDIVETVLMHYESICDKFIQENTEDVICIVLRRRFLRVYRYSGIGMAPYIQNRFYITNDEGEERYVEFNDYQSEGADFYGAPRWWKYQTDCLNLEREFEFYKMGYCDLDQEQMYSFSEALREKLTEQLSNLKNLKIRDYQGFIVFDFKDCYKKLKSAMY